eukprot:scaffold108523_cov43-Tisochrysis_lutea.AAC.1
MSAASSVSYECGELELAGAEVVHLSDEKRNATFVVEKFVLRGVQLSETCSKEFSVVKEMMLRTPIDPQESHTPAHARSGIWRCHAAQLSFDDVFLSRCCPPSAMPHVQVLRESKSVSEALGHIAVNASNACCARLNHAWEGKVTPRCNILRVTQ